jgi:CheY-like chemotaxis protein
VFHHFPRLCVGVGFLAVLLSQAPAQEGRDAPKKQPDKEPPPGKVETEKTGDDYRQFFKKPETPADFWGAIQFEIDVGRYDLAAGYLRGLLARNPTDKELFDLESKEGMAAFLRLRNVPKWSDDAKVDAQAKKDVDELITRVSNAVRATLNDPARIKRYVQNLLAGPEEYAYAIKELYRPGASAVPYLLEELRNATGSDRLTLLKALRQLGPDTLAPLAAALDSNDVQLKLDLLGIFKARAATAVIPDLYFLIGSTNQPEAVRRKAAETLAYLLDVPVTRLPSPKVALTQEADRYYRHQVPFANPNSVTVWRWDGKNVVAGWPGAPTVSASRAEEYYGLRYAGQALALDPTYLPAQVVLLSLALDKGYERAGLTQPLARAAPQVYQLLATVSPELLLAALDRALTDQRVPVILGTLRALGDLAEVRAIRPTGKGQPGLVRALYFPDRRVQMAAADALARIPAPPPPGASARVVEVLRRALAGEPGTTAKAKVLIGFTNPDFAAKVADSVRQAGYEPVTVHTARDVVRRLNQAADVDLLLLDAGLIDPGINWLLAQLRADANAANLPLILVAPPGREEALRRLTEGSPNVIVAPTGIGLESQKLGELLAARLGEASSPPLTEAERKGFAEIAVRYLDGMARGDLKGYDVSPAGDTLIAALRVGQLSPEGQAAAINVVSHLPLPRAQSELAAVVMDAKRLLPLRDMAARVLVRHVQEHGVLLNREQIAALEGLAAQADTKPELKADLALLVGSLHPDARQTGERLLRYQPPAPSPPREKE